MAFTDFLNGYTEAAIWSSTDDQGEPLDRTHGEKDLAPETLASFEADCRKFYDANFDLISDNLVDAGRDFWFTRNGHGAGFWDGDWPESGDKLTEASKAFGETNLYVGDDGLIYSC